MGADRDIAELLERMVLADDYPCLGAKSVFRRGRAVVREFGAMDDPATGPALASALTEFGEEFAQQEEFASFVATFSDEDVDSEIDYERTVWAMLQQIHEADCEPWDPAVSNDPLNPHFGFSVGGHAFFVVGMHPRASRVARRTPVPVAVFNLHAQFTRLRESGRFERMRDTIRRRDAELQGGTNPNLADHGSVTEARQYSGRAVEPGWIPPFEPHEGDGRESPCV
ncbi:guanitoxin biosynthesis heme-dependent pre-guanitoxin N-hydroxylase GntA [Actinomycetota bacterium]